MWVQCQFPMPIGVMHPDRLFVDRLVTHEALVRASLRILLARLKHLDFTFQFFGLFVLLLR